jgi:hypothetical protein
MKRGGREEGGIDTAANCAKGGEGGEISHKAKPLFGFGLVFGFFLSCFADKRT